MKTKSPSILSIALISLIFFLISGSKGLCQNEPKASNAVVIPDNLKAVFQNSYMPCHWKGGGIKSTFHVNFSKWDDYEPKTQIQKAGKLCSVIVDDKMPPASARKTRPDIVLTKDQIEAVCKWSESLPKESQTVSSK
jgi:hypothetical protein